MKIMLVLAGGALGTLARFYTSTFAQKYVTNGFPIGTLMVNLTGSFVIGLLWGLFENQQATSLRTFLFVGILGGFTTFSAYSIETLNLFRDGYLRQAILNILLNNVVGILLALGGLTLAKFIR
ncbi:MAG TPA: fluoride efflux transporter CrcB [Cyclobacteriaceae bacterium]|nr:fluoride efflux transporter CrcB [Cyclobacteriaceae bacterium]